MASGGGRVRVAFFSARWILAESLEEPRARRMATLAPWFGPLRQRVADRFTSWATHAVSRPSNKPMQRTALRAAAERGVRRL